MKKKIVKRKSTKGMIIRSFRGSFTSTYKEQLKRIEEFQKSIGMDKYKDLEV